MDKRFVKACFPHIYHFYKYLHYIHALSDIHKQNEYWEKFPESMYPQFLSEKYKSIFNYSFDWNNPLTYTEKMQWDKIFNRDPLKTTLSDKYAVRDWVESKIGPNYLIPLLGVWEKSSLINWDALPESFVLKTNKGSGDIKIIKEKSLLSRLDRKQIEMDLDLSMCKDYAFDCGFELQYKDIKPLIIAEKFMGENIYDYKFTCFSGEPHFCWVDTDRFTEHKRAIYDMNWNRSVWTDCIAIEKREMPCPPNFEEMKRIAAELSSGFGQVRVDLYNIDGYIYFGEMTFSNGSGFLPVNPPEFNAYLGSLWILDRNHMPDISTCNN